MKAFLRVKILLPLIALSLVGCKQGGSSSAQSSQGAQQDITINITSEPQTLDPRKVRALNDANVIRMFPDNKQLSRLISHESPLSEINALVSLLDSGLAARTLVTFN